MNNKKPGAFLCGLLGMAGSALAADSAAQPADAPPPAVAEPIKIEVFTEARIVHGPTSNLYPRDQVNDGREGWVVVNTMIDSQGKPYEAMVAASSGNMALEKAALKGLTQMQFAPAHRGNSATDSSITFKMKFAIADLAMGAAPQFVNHYRRLMKAVEASDRTSADVELAALKPQNLYEESFTYLGKYQYHLRWGTAAEQLDDLTRAIAGEKKPGYLPKDNFVAALTQKFRLEALSGAYASALETWDVLEPLATKEIRAGLQNPVDKIRALQASNQPLHNSAEIDEHGYWASDLFRNRFSIAVASGAVTEIKLRCAEQYLFFKYEPSMQYSVGSKKDQHCGIQVVGDAGTKFDLIE